jgi:hypothetical protein
MRINSRMATSLLRVHSRALKLGVCLAVFAPALAALGQSSSPSFVTTNPYVLSAAIAPPAGDKITSFDISWVDALHHK